jgi:hypothetical protein
LKNSFLTIFFVFIIPECRKGYYSPWFGQWLSHLPETELKL